MFLGLFLLGLGYMQGQNGIVQGIVTDSITGEALPYVSILVKGTTTGSTTDDAGHFSFSVPPYNSNHIKHNRFTSLFFIAKIAVSRKAIIEKSKLRANLL